MGTMGVYLGTHCNGSSFLVECFFGYKLCISGRRIFFWFLVGLPFVWASDRAQYLQFESRLLHEVLQMIDLDGNACCHEWCLSCWTSLLVWNLSGQSSFWLIPLYNAQNGKCWRCLFYIFCTKRMHSTLPHQWNITFLYHLMVFRGQE